MYKTNDAEDSASTILIAEKLHIASYSSLPALVMSLVVRPGELHLFYSKDVARSRAVVDGLLGLDVGGTGSVRYLNRAWADLTPADAFRWRRSVGRVQREGNWMETRSVLENILLPRKHHTVLPENLLRDKVGSLAQRFGLPGLPMHLPHECPPADLARAACIRAFLGHPMLVALEHPMVFEDLDLLSPMMNAIQQVRQRKGAVIWFTEHLALVTDISIPADRRYQIAGSQLLDL
jgi:phospholipid/cholesterol/gamma-HCH transport system ATP-binding protein